MSEDHITVDDMTSACLHATPEAINADGLVAVWHPPAGKAPAVITLGGSEGGIAVANDLACGLRHPAMGVLALSYFGDPGLPSTLENIPLEYFERAVRWLETNPIVEGGKLGIVGYSVGAEAALVLASRFPEIKATAALMPSSHIFQGIGEFGTMDRRSSFTQAGVPLPYLPYDLSAPFSTALDLYQRSLARRGRHPDAEIQVERANGGILMVSASDDEVWPCTAMAHDIMDRLETRGFRHDRRHIVIEGGHAAVLSPSFRGGEPTNTDTYEKIRALVSDFLLSEFR